MSALRGLARALAVRAARGYLGGADLPGALSTCDELASRGVGAFTLGYWNPSGEPPAEVARHYTEAVRFLAGAALPYAVRVALKTPAFGFQPEVLDALLPSRVPLHLDAHGIDTQDATLALGLSAPTRVGVTLPGRWKRSATDATMAARHGLTVRVVKGQFAAGAAAECDPSPGFLTVVGALSHGAARVQVATHDPVVARRALAVLREAGTPCELELLYGLPPGPALAVAHELDVPCRVYVPWGFGFLPYALSGLKRDPKIALWLARDLVLRRRRWPAPGEIPQLRDRGGAIPLA